MADTRNITFWFLCSNGYFFVYVTDIFVVIQVHGLLVEGHQVRECMAEHGRAWKEGCPGKVTAKSKRGWGAAKCCIHHRVQASPALLCHSGRILMCSSSNPNPVALAPAAHLALAPSVAASTIPSGPPSALPPFRHERCPRRDARRAAARALAASECLAMVAIHFTLRSGVVTWSPLTAFTSPPIPLCT